ncbi:MAG: hypothetical protein HN849_08345 [Victivallales bacterium]|jgi:hypothetical protein|nr:hypothetical protein [Victivallales bacterium]MBT7299507.1 hypothetical protein [Victivallales bacterium]
MRYLYRVESYECSLQMLVSSQPARDALQDALKRVGDDGGELVEMKEVNDKLLLVFKTARD